MFKPCEYDIYILFMQVKTQFNTIIECFEYDVQPHLWLPPTPGNWNGATPRHTTLYNYRDIKFIFDSINMFLIELTYIYKYYVHIIYIYIVILIDFNHFYIEFRLLFIYFTNSNKIMSIYIRLHCKMFKIVNFHLRLRFQ